MCCSTVQGRRSWCNPTNEHSFVPGWLPLQPRRRLTFAAHAAAGIARRCTDIASCPLHALCWTFLSVPPSFSLCATFNLGCCGAANRPHLLRCPTLYIPPLPCHNCLPIDCCHLHIEPPPQAVECKRLLYFFSYTRYTRAGPIRRSALLCSCMQLPHATTAAGAAATASGALGCHGSGGWTSISMLSNAARQTPDGSKGGGWSRAHMLAVA